MFICKKSIFSLFLVLFCFTSIFSYANERRFTYTYQSGVLAPGEKELEIWSTGKVGRQTGYYARMENRMEFEVGLTKKLQTAFYLNFRNTTSSDETGATESHFEFKGISSEWKYQFTDPSRDALGFALYGEVGLNSDEVEFETKLIFDKKIGKTILALNLVAEPEWGLSNGPADYELNFEGTFGLSHSFSPSFAAGFEIRNHNEYVTEDGWEHSALFAGPVLSYSHPNWWMSFTLLPQITAFKGKSEGSELNLIDHEKLESRLLFSFRF